jgi:protein-tyrosine phosphatase
MIDAVTARIPELEGALNFRDLGGYRAADGRTVRWNHVYRSGTTHAMTASDVAQLSAQGIRYAYDLRSNNERRSHPNRLRDIANLDYRFRDHDHLPGDIRRLLKSPDVRAEHSHRVMIDVYKKLPYEFEDAFRALFHWLAEGEVPLVFNCTAGKDRTGAAAALLLTALGVSREEVLEDYLLTAQFFERSCDMILHEGGAPLFAALDRAVWEPLMQVHPEYLEAMFDQLEASHGSVDRYLREQLGMHDARTEQLRSHLLE